MKKGKRKKPVLSDEVQSEMMTAHEVARYLNCHFFTVYRLIRQNALPGFRLGSVGDWWFRRSEIDQWIAARQVHPPQTTVQKPDGKQRGKRKA
jgi:excisionase family DNA binding protein